MAGRGPAPKPADKRVRHGGTTQPKSTVVRFEPAAAPGLPEDMEWHPRTVAWWEMWKSSPQAEHFMATDWDFLLDTALMHSAMWAKGQWTLAAEVRLRVAKYGATPEDRARLRMTFADADAKDEKRASTSTDDVRKRYGALKAVPGGK